MALHQDTLQFTITAAEFIHLLPGPCGTSFGVSLLPSNLLPYSLRNLPQGPPLDSLCRAEQGVYFKLMVLWGHSGSPLLCFPLEEAELC